MDFLVLDTESVVNMNSKIPIILGRPFLATMNALINCRNGLMKIPFVNMTLEVNIFHIKKQPWDDDECHQTFMIETLFSKEVHMQQNSNNPKDLIQNSISKSFDLWWVSQHSSHDSKIKAKINRSRIWAKPTGVSLRFSPTSLDIENTVWFRFEVVCIFLHKEFCVVCITLSQNFYSCLNMISWCYLGQLCHHWLLRNNIRVLVHITKPSGKMVVIAF